MVYLGLYVSLVMIFLVEEGEEEEEE